MTDVLLDALAIYRLHRLAMRDDITEPLRERVGLGMERGPLTDLKPFLACPWCAGWWLGVGCLAFGAAFPRAWRAVRLPLAVNAIVGLVTESEH